MDTREERAFVEFGHVYCTQLAAEFNITVVADEVYQLLCFPGVPGVRLFVVRVAGA